MKVICPVFVVGKCPVEACDHSIDHDHSIHCTGNERNGLCKNCIPTEEMQTGKMESETGETVVME